MRTLTTTNGINFTVDEEDFEWVSKKVWWGDKHYSTSGTIKYTYVRETGMKSNPLHRTLAKAKKGQVVDHADGNSLNNCRSNLRICSHAENIRNQKIRKDNTSGYKGVYFQDSRKKKKWIAQVYFQSKGHVSTHFTAKEAALAYNERAKKYHGEFVRLNVII